MNAAKQAMLGALKQAYGGEVLFRPSNASRWMSCPGSVQLIAQIPRDVRDQPAGEAAREGSGAHALAQIVLTTKQAPIEYVGRHMMVNDNPKDLVLVDAEMAEKITEYVELVNSYLATPGSELLVERHLSLSHLDPSDPLLAECSGTGDALVVNRTFRWVVDIDLKYGKGVPVSATSPQVKIYALMAALEFQVPGVGWEWIGTTVFQPRLPLPRYTEEDFIKPFNYKPQELFGSFLGEVYQAMDAALGPDPRFAPSQGACMWCPARTRVAGEPGYCKALQAKALEIGYDPFDYRIGKAMVVGPVPEFVMLEPGQKAVSAYPGMLNPNVVVLPNVDEVDVGELSAVLRGRALLKLWLKGYEHRAVQLLGAGVDIPGFSLKQRAGHRKFVKPDNEVIAQVMAAGVPKNQLWTEPKLKSPAQLEKLVPSAMKGMFQPGYGLVEKPLGGYELVAKSGDLIEGPGPVDFDFEDN